MKLRKWNMCIPFHDLRKHYAFQREKPLKQNKGCAEQNSGSFGGADDILELQINIYPIQHLHPIPTNDRNKIVLKTMVLTMIIHLIRWRRRRMT
jgi:hypothetical protein